MVVAVPTSAGNAGPRIGKSRHAIRAEAVAAEGQHSVDRAVCARLAHKRNHCFDVYLYLARTSYGHPQSMNAWRDRDEMLGNWKDAFTCNLTNPGGALEPEADFSKPRVIGQATKRRKAGDD